MSLALARFCREASDGSLPADASGVLCCATLIPLKKANGGIRPIAIGEILRRLIGKTILQNPLCKSQLSKLQPLQAGLGTPHACEMIAMGVQNMIQLLPTEGDWAVLQLDLSNAFNSVSRTAVLEGAKALAPNTYNWLRFCYARPVPLYCGDKVLASETGVHQGDPLGPAGFALAIHAEIKAILTSTPTLWGSFYLDDGLLIGRTPLLLAALDKLATFFSSVGLSVNPTKTTLWGPSVHTLTLTPACCEVTCIP